MNVLWKYLPGFRGLIGAALLLAGLSQGLTMMDPLILQRMLEAYVTHADRFGQWEFVKGVGAGVGLMVAVALLARVAKNYQDYFVNVVTQKVGARIYCDGVRHLLDLPYADFEDLKSGETLDQLQRVRTDVEKLINVAVGLLFTTVIALIFVVVYAARIHWAIGPTYLLTIPAMGGVSALLTRRATSMRKKILAETTALAGSTTESLRNIELIKGLGLAKQEVGRLNSTTERIVELELKKVRYLRKLGFVQSMLVTLLRSSVIFLSMLLIFTHRISITEFIALFIYSFLIFGPLQELGNVFNVYRDAEVSLRSFQTIMAARPEAEPAHPVSVAKLDTVEFRNVGFQHQTASCPALDDISFTVACGETIAFAGTSGAGKTTLVKLLAGLYKPATGHVYYNGERQDRIAMDDLRGRMGLVTQDTQLFSGSIRDNLLFVRPEATDEECLDVLGQASLLPLLARANRGLDTMIGEGGVKVSGGEKQRLSIARALLRQPQLLVFDEATSSLDSLTEEEISHTIRTVAAGRDAITILIAHRLSTVLHADCIYVLERGRIVESGRHDELVDRKGLYYAMWRQQVGEALPAAV